MQSYHILTGYVYFQAFTVLVVYLHEHFMVPSLKDYLMLI